MIVDLAIMLTMAALATIVFKKLAIPTILGYILAGFITGPHFPMFLDVESTGSIETWSEIGVVIILFRIGLEFDLHKLANIGYTAVVSALVKIAGVMAVGYGFGTLMGLSPINCVFLGAMLSISSTVVIQKSLTELGLEKEKYSTLVMGSLVVEDLISIFIMVILTTLSLGQSGGTITGTLIHLALLICYLIIWLILGIFIVPSFLNRVMEYLSDEMLTLLSLGFCFLMSLLANKLGFSMELGAFIAGSFFAGTQYVHRIEHVTTGITDVFGAIFFLSVGMMVDPGIIAARWTTILPLAVLAVIAKLLFETVGMLLSGQTVDTAIRSGLALAPIGEFSFIIANLGISLKVMDEYLYPVIVASSILTIIATPVLINKSGKIAKWIYDRLPDRFKNVLDEYTSSQAEDTKQDAEWVIVLKDYGRKVGIYGSIMLVTALAGHRLIEPSLAHVFDDGASRLAALLIVYSVILIFVKPFMSTRNIAFTHLWLKHFANRPPLVVLVTSKVIILIMIAAVPLRMMYSVNFLYIVLVTIVLIVVIYRLDFISSYYLKLEARFLSNLNQRTVGDRSADQRSSWLDEDYSIFSWIVPDGAPYIGKQIKDLSWGRIYNVYVVKLRRDGRSAAMPAAKTVLRAGDKVHIIGDEQSLRIFHKTLDVGELTNLRTLREFLDAGYPDRDHALACLALKVRGTEHYAGKTIKRSGINNNSHCMILGIERGSYKTTMPDANMVIEKGDVLWLIGTADTLNRIAAHSNEI